MKGEYIRTGAAESGERRRQGRPCAVRWPAAYLELDSGLHAKLQFVTQGIADRYGALQLSAISRTRGEIDRVTVRFEDVWGGQAPYLWRCDGKTEWYGAVPTPGDMELLARQIETFCALYEQDPRQEMCGMGY